MADAPDGPQTTLASPTTPADDHAAVAGDSISSPVKNVGAPVADLPPEGEDSDAVPAGAVENEEGAGEPSVAELQQPGAASDVEAEGRADEHPRVAAADGDTAVVAGQEEDAAPQDDEHQQLPLTPGLIASRKPVTLKQATYAELPEEFTDGQLLNADYVKRHMLEERTAWMTNPVLHARPEDYHPLVYMFCYLLGTLEESERQRICLRMGIRYGTYAGRTLAANHAADDAAATEKS
ncbi:unnamed protein product [Amoebophrya sp. A120]|nr:unnamed protein product [Amoebophrya sp. A120]|eukprot:GSA120T00022638001.1